MSTTIATLESVSKQFKVFTDKTLKERFLNFGSARQNAQEFWALQDVTLDIPLGSTLGLVGHNGSGKSTLLKILGGIFQPTSGDVMRRGRLAALLELGAGFHPDMTGRENVFLSSALVGMAKKQTQRHLEEIIDFSGIEQFIDTPVKFYSSGMYVRLAFAASIFSDPDLLLVDEVLAVGDEPFQAKCLSKIREFQREGRSIVLVTHSSATTREFCNQVAVLDRGKLRFAGDTQAGLDALNDIYAESSANESKPRADSRIRRVTVSPSHVTATGEIPLGASLSVSIDIDLRQVIEPASVEVSFVSGSGQLVYHVSSRDLALEIPQGAQSSTIALDLPDQHLGGGEYHVGVELIDGAQRSVEKQDRATVFLVESASFGRGTARFDVTGSVN